ncbi:28S ribosomal protein S31, mitochondrial [Monomorium pharaonis]|uniref:28S ribosomal protein S31, mitochondrial n=1 Tax=Monomorium pharaonis TaxID=307658 RepID=UPI00063FA1BF|nr:28S ribosomal protein S31, mitochondrial [Monomorium pharaonis]
MLPLYILLRCNIRSSKGMLFQWINNSTRLCSSSSSFSSSSTSDSSDSSDSDSDTDKAKPKTTDVKSTNPTDTMSDNKYDLKSFVDNMIQARKLQKKTIEVAMQPKKKAKLKNDKRVPFEKQVVDAAKDVAEKLGGDKTKTTSDLLEKVLKSRVKALKEEQTRIEIEENAKFKQSKHNVQEQEISQDKHSEKKSIIQTLLDEYNKRPKIVEDSISRKLLNSAKVSKNQLQDKEKLHGSKRRDINLWNGEPSPIFENMRSESPNMLELKTWATLEQKELKAMTTYPPANVFQELILWTEQGKLWKFPIDNEQGIEEEQSVHFSEHVFMERHLKGWCPKSGPIRHFMELVCVGLSKNPYMTVQEKVQHIMWYKEYFKSKQDLLQEIGAIQEPFPDKIKEITE